jgi:nucleoside-triphosphatase THEP1
VVEMKIAVCGKGGKGKSTVVALLASGFKEKGMGVIIIDSEESRKWRRKGFLFWGRFHSVRELLEHVFMDNRLSWLTVVAR